jgi:SAM-dependent methyltransferase
MYIVDKFYSKIWTKDVKICFWKSIIEFILCRDYIARSNILKWVLKHANKMSGKLLDIWCWKKPYEKIFHNVEQYIWIDVEVSWHDHSTSCVDVFYDWENIPFPNENFDCVFSTQVFEHVENIEKVMKESNRVLKKWWYVLVSMPFVWPEHEKPYDFRRWTTFWIKKNFKLMWFDVIDLKKSTSDVLAIWSLFLSYLVSILPFYNRRKVFTVFWQLILITPLMCLIYLFNFLLPNKWDLFLDNIVLAKKIK